MPDKPSTPIPTAVQNRMNQGIKLHQAIASMSLGEVKTTKRR